MTRTDLLNHLIQKHGLTCYLEIGLQDAKQNFDKIQCEYKVSVDPDPKAGAMYEHTSDDFFYFWQPNEDDTYERFDLIFIDGLHTAEQVKKDFENALQVLTPNGFIVLHDCNPLKEEHTIVPRPTERGHWNGDVYRFASALLHKGKYTVDIDNGCMVCPGTRDKYQILHMPFSTWELFNNWRRELLNLISWDEFVKLNN